MPLPPGHELAFPPEPLNLDQMPTGTVGAVALDVRGCVCAVTSTGGRTNKQVGRVGDTPHMGSGFWAEEWKIRGLFRKVWDKVRGRSPVRAMGISGTGDGDYVCLLHFLLCGTVLMSVACLFAVHQAEHSVNDGEADAVSRRVSQRGGRLGGRRSQST